MRTKLTAQLLTLSAALVLPGLAAAQFPYSAWDCSAMFNRCSPALIPGPGETITWGDPPQWPGFDEFGPSYSDETVSNFQKAFAQVEKISQNFTAAAPKNATAEDTKKLREEAHAKALEALESANIERSQYNRIAAYMDRNLDLRMRVMGDSS